jgi:hypothetical protein
LLDFARELQLEECSEDLRGGDLRLQTLHNFVNVSSLVGFQEGVNLLLVRSQPCVFPE